MHPFERLPNLSKKVGQTNKEKAIFCLVFEASFRHVLGCYSSVCVFVQCSSSSGGAKMWKLDFVGSLWKASSLFDMYGNSIWKLLCVCVRLCAKSMFYLSLPKCLAKPLLKIGKIHLLFRWDVSNFIVFLVAGCTVTFLLSVVLIEKFTCVPKRLSRVIVQLTGNKMLHQMMAITNVLTLLSCVLLPLVRTIFHFLT